MALTTAELLSGVRTPEGVPTLVGPTGRPADLTAYRALRRATFVDEQQLFDRTDRDALDDHPDTVVIVAHDPDGTVAGGVRIAPGDPDRDLAWWTGSRLVVAPGHRGGQEIGAALVRAAAAVAEARGALRFDAVVQTDRRRFFERLGWRTVAPTQCQGRPHVAMRWPIGRLARQSSSKAPLGALLAGLAPGGAGFVGDDAAPVPGSDLVAACDAVLPAMVERDPWWAGWCGVLVNVNDLAAEGALPVGLLDAVGARTASQAARVLAGLRAAADAWRVPVLGGHTTLDVAASLSVTALGRLGPDGPVAGGGGRQGDVVTVAADLDGGWRRGYEGRQWDSTTGRSGDELAALGSLVARWRPAAAKDVSMAGLVGSLGMLAEASGCGAELDLAAVPAPSGAGLADWLCCFPGFGIVAADRPTAPTGGATPPPPSPATTAACGRLTAGNGITVAWPDGERIEVLSGAVTNLGVA